jgi:hypothetical protein
MRDRSRGRGHVRAEGLPRAFFKKPWGPKSPRRGSPGHWTVVSSRLAARSSAKRASCQGVH